MPDSAAAAGRLCSCYTLQARLTSSCTRPAFPWSYHRRETACSERQPRRSWSFTPKGSRPCSLLRVPAAHRRLRCRTGRRRHVVRRLQPCRSVPACFRRVPFAPPAKRFSRRPKVRPAAMEQNHPRESAADRILAQVHRRLAVPTTYTTQVLPRCPRQRITASERPWVVRNSINNSNSIARSSTAAMALTDTTVPLRVPTPPLSTLITRAL